MNRMAVGVFVVILVGAFVSAQSKPSIQGVWRVAEVTTTGPNASTNKSPQPGLYIFTGKYFSIIRDTSPKPRLPVGANPTPDEALATYGPLQARSGTYEVSGNAINYVVLTAKNPPYGRRETDTFKIDGDTLWITSVIGGRGKVANPTTLRLVRVE